MEFNGFIYRIADIHFKLDRKKHTVEIAESGERIANNSRDLNFSTFQSVLAGDAPQGYAMLSNVLKEHLHQVGQNLDIEFDPADFEFRIAESIVSNGKFILNSFGVLENYFALEFKDVEIVENN